MAENRVIKFRAWDENEKIMVMNPLNFPEKYALNTLMQFTGLLDKNGKEIYEGDILTGWRKGSNSERVYTGVIKWQTEQAGWMIICGKFNMEILSLAMSGDGTETRLDSFEVIGNIYTNPELLTPKS